MNARSTPILPNPAAARRLLRAGLPAAALLALAACGSGSEAPAPPPAPTAVSISAANQDAVARAAANTVVSAGTVGAVAPLAVDGRVTAAAKLGLGTAAAPSLDGAGSVTAVLQRLGRFALAAGRPSAAAADAVRVLAVTTQTTACAVSGTLTISVNDADNSGTLNGGDSIGFAFAACKPTATEMINGSMTLTVTTASANAVAGALSFAALGATGPDGSFSINGSVSLSYTEVGTLATYQMVIGAGGLSTAVVTPQYSDTLTLGGGFEQTVTYDSAALPPGSTVAGLGTARVNGTISATSLGGTVTLATTAPFQQYEIDAYPRAGQLRASGANGSAVRLTALSATTVRIELDANGDGTYEQSREVPWAALI